jgi:phosphoglycolate phosphatase
MMKQPFDLIIFDWDGTLMDSTANIIRAIQGACEDLGFDRPTDKEAAYIIGLSLPEAFKILCPTMSQEIYPKLVAAYQKHFALGEPVLFDGVYNGLKQLQQAGLPLSVATGKGRHGLNRAMEMTHTTSFFDTTRTVSECLSKPHPEMILSICSELTINPERTLMVGDTTHDLTMAQNAGCAAVGLTTGAHDKTQLNSVAHLRLFENITDFFHWLS